MKYNSRSMISTSSIVAAIVATCLGAQEAQAMCGSGFPVVTGPEPDLFFIIGSQQEKTVSITYHSANRWTHCQVVARGNSEHITVEQVYGTNQFVSYPGYARVGPHVIVGSTHTTTFRVRANFPGLVGYARVDLFAEIGEFNPSYTAIGAINVFVSPSSYQNTNFQITASAANLTLPYIMHLDHPLLNGNNTHRPLVSQVFNNVYNPHPLGVEYNYNYNRWHLVNQDLQAIPVGTRFNVKIEGGATYVHQVNSGNKAGHYTWIDNPISNSNPEALVFVTPIAFSASGRHPHNIGVWYDTWKQKWSIFSQDFTAMPDSAFLVRIVGRAQPAPAPGAMTHSATSPSYNHTVIDNSNWNSASRLIFTPNWSPHQVYNDHATGLWWTGANWAIYNEDIASMPLNASFNVWRLSDAL